MNSSLATTMVLLGLVLVSGCVSYDFESIVRQNPTINNFLAQHPNATITAAHFSKSESQAIIQNISSDCGKSVVANEFYRVQVADAVSGTYITAWLDPNSKIVECVLTQTVTSDGSDNNELKECLSYDNSTRNWLTAYSLCNSNQDCIDFVKQLTSGQFQVKCVQTSFKKVENEGIGANCTTNDDCYAIFNMPYAINNASLSDILSKSFKQMIRCQNNSCEATEAISKIFAYISRLQDTCTDANVLIQHAIYDPVSRNLTVTINNYGKVALRLNLTISSINGTNSTYGTMDIEPLITRSWVIENVDSCVRSVEVRSTTCTAPCVACPTRSDFIRGNNVNGMGSLECYKLLINYTAPV